MVGQSDARREIIEIRTDDSRSASVLNGKFGAERGRQRRSLPMRSNQRERVEIERGLVIVGLFDRGEEFVAQAEVQCEARSCFEIVERIDRVNLPVVNNIRGHTGDRPAIANSLHETGEGLAAGAGSREIVVDKEVAAEVHCAARGGRFEDGELLEPKFAAELRGVASVNPAQIVGKNVAVLVLDSRQVFRRANGCGAIPKTKIRQAADVLARLERNSGERNGELCRNVLVGIQVVAMRTQVIETEAEFVDQIIAKCMDLTGGQALRCVVAGAILKTTAVEHVAEWRRKKVTVVAVTEAGEKIIFGADGLVDANVELVFRLAAFRIREVIARGKKSTNVNVGRGK